MLKRFTALLASLLCLMMSRDAGATHTRDLNSAGGMYFSTGPLDSSLNQAPHLPGDFNFRQWQASPADQQAVLSCLRNIFADFDVEVVTEEPINSPYTEVVFGLDPLEVGYPLGVSAAAPHGCSPLDNGIIFTFPSVVDSDPIRTCQSIAYGIGAAQTLSETIVKEDMMSIEEYTDKRFLDEEVICDREACDCGGSTQNGYQVLLDTFGPAGGAEVPSGCSQGNGHGLSFLLITLLGAYLSRRRFVRPRADQ
jgi:hypothetical protein